MQHTERGKTSMSEKIEITKETILEARDYVPLTEKEDWVADVAPKCFNKLAITADGEPVPPMYMVSTGLKCRYLMAALAGMYFGAEYQGDEKDPTMMSEAEYDRWASSHVLNQLERMKRESDVRDKCFDLLTDYKDLEKRLSSQINSLLTVQNDSVIRQTQYTTAQMKELPLILAQLKELQGKVDEASGDA